MRLKEKWPLSDFSIFLESEEIFVCPQKYEKKMILRMIVKMTKSVKSSEKNRHVDWIKLNSKMISNYRQANMKDYMPRWNWTVKWLLWGKKSLSRSLLYTKNWIGAIMAYKRHTQTYCWWHFSLFLNFLSFSQNKNISKKWF